MFTDSPLRSHRRVYRELLSMGVVSLRVLVGFLFCLFFYKSLGNFASLYFVGLASVFQNSNSLYYIHSFTFHPT